MSLTGTRRRWIALGAALLVVIVALALFALSKVRTLEVEQITPDVHAIFGLGGNVGVLRTDAGTVIVDTMTTAWQGGWIRERAEALTGQPVVMAINTHYHSDHTHGNPGLTRGTRVVATRQTLELLKRCDSGYWEGDRAGFLPNEIFELEREIAVGGKTVRLYHPGRGHTDGDLVALFVEDRVLHAGDLYFNRCYPNIDLAGGGTVRGWGDTLDRVLELPFDRVIPGHGAIGGREGLVQFQRFVRQLAAVGERGAREGWSREDAIRRAELTEDAGYRPTIPFLLTRDFVIGKAWDEATGAVSPCGE